MEPKVQSRMPVQAFLETAASRPGEIAMVQPVGGDKVIEERKRHLELNFQSLIVVAA